MRRDDWKTLLVEAWAFVAVAAIAFVGELPRSPISRPRPARGLVFPRFDGEPWTETDYGNWRRRIFHPLCAARPYDLRHTFASLLIWEGRPITYVAQQLGHSPQTCLTTYAHVIDGVEANLPAEDAIRMNRQEGAPPAAAAA